MDITRSAAALPPSLVLLVALGRSGVLGPMLTAYVRFG